MLVHAVDAARTGTFAAVAAGVEAGLEIPGDATPVLAPDAPPPDVSAAAAATDSPDASICTFVGIVRTGTMTLKQYPSIL